MEGGQWMVVLIVAIVMVAGIIRTAMGGGKRRHHRNGEAIGAEERAENAQLRAEVKQLKDRLAVLERITVEKENSLEREIEALRRP